MLGNENIELCWLPSSGYWAVKQASVLTMGLEWDGSSTSLIQPFLFFSSLNQADPYHPPMTSKEKYSSKISGWNLRLKKVSQRHTNDKACTHCVFGQVSCLKWNLFKTTDLGEEGSITVLHILFRAKWPHWHLSVGFLRWEKHIHIFIRCRIWNDPEAKW